MTFWGSSWAALGMALFVAFFHPSKGSMLPTHRAPMWPSPPHGDVAMLRFFPVLVMRARQLWLLCRHPRRIAESIGV